ncbi:GAF domain-containing protein [Curtobacterium flaccumfaciens]|nr:GAF domain-containing protein [Curtobacterium flaccumfaciens]
MTTSDETAFPDRVARVLEPGLDVLDAVDRVIAACVEATSAIEAGIVIADRFGTLQVLASTSERSSEAEEAQLGTDEGSCLDCYRTGTTVDVADVSTHESEWPAFVTTMRDRGLQGTFAEPIRLRDRTIGSLCVFADHTPRAQRRGRRADPTARRRRFGCPRAPAGPWWPRHDRGPGRGRPRGAGARRAGEGCARLPAGHPDGRGVPAAATCCGRRRPQPPRAGRGRRAPGRRPRQHRLGPSGPRPVRLRPQHQAVVVGGERHRDHLAERIAVELHALGGVDGQPERPRPGVPERT